jgi:hypothetical protein
MMTREISAEQLALTEAEAGSAVLVAVLETRNERKGEPSGTVARIEGR